MRKAFSKWTTVQKNYSRNGHEEYMLNKLNFFCLEDLIIYFNSNVFLYEVS